MAIILAPSPLHPLLLLLLFPSSGVAGFPSSTLSCPLSLHLALAPHFEMVLLAFISVLRHNFLKCQLHNLVGVCCFCTIYDGVSTHCYCRLKEEVELCRMSMATQSKKLETLESAYEEHERLKEAVERTASLHASKLGTYFPVDIIIIIITLFRQTLGDC